MGTSANLVFFDNNCLLVNMYFQCDGYPAGAGCDVAKFLSDMKLVVGLTKSEEKCANGMGCLAAQFIAHTKDCAGYLYIIQPDHSSPEYTYEVHGNSQSPKDGVKIRYNDKYYTPKEFLEKYSE